MKITSVKQHWILGTMILQPYIRMIFYGMMNSACGTIQEACCNLTIQLMYVWDSKQCTYSIIIMEQCQVLNVLSSDDVFELRVCLILNEDVGLCKLL